MITPVVFLLFVATVPLLGGRLSRLGEIRLTGWWAILASLVIQIVLIEVLSDALDGFVAAVLHLGSYGLAFVFVWLNRHVVGMGIMVLGGVLNAAAIAANGGVMPAQLDALETAGIISDSPTFENSAPVENARLAFLGDVFAIPEGIPFANVFSVGDVLLVFGAGFTVHVVSQSKLGRLFRRPSQAAEDPLASGIDAHPIVDSVLPTLEPAHGRTESIATPAKGTAEESLAVRYHQSMAIRRGGMVAMSQQPSEHAS